MTGHNYVGATPTSPEDLATKLRISQLVAAADPNQVSATTDVNTAAALKAAKAYVDTQAAAYATPSYMTTRDALNVPLTAKGQLNGVATLGADGKILPSQIPAVGAGWVLGPYGPTSGTSAITDSTPVRIADWDIGIQSITFEPWVFCTIVAGATNMGRPVIEVGISDGTTTDYGDQTIVARGYGRSFYNDGQVVNVMPLPISSPHSGDDSTVFTPTYDIFLSAWLYDSQDQTVSVADGSILSGAVFLIRTTE